MSMTKAITETVSNMSIEQLLLAAEMEGIAIIGWDNHLHLQAYVFFQTLATGRHRHTFMVDKARQIVDFPEDARKTLVDLLVKELVRGRNDE